MNRITRHILCILVAITMVGCHSSGQKTSPTSMNLSPLARYRVPASLTAFKVVFGDRTVETAKSDHRKYAGGVKATIVAMVGEQEYNLHLPLRYTKENCTALMTLIAGKPDIILKDDDHPNSSRNRGVEKSKITEGGTAIGINVGWYVWERLSINDVPMSDPFIYNFSDRINAIATLYKENMGLRLRKEYALAINNIAAKNAHLVTVVDNLEDGDTTGSSRLVDTSLAEVWWDSISDGDKQIFAETMRLKEEAEKSGASGGDSSTTTTSPDASGDGGSSDLKDDKKNDDS